MFLAAHTESDIIVNQNVSIEGLDQAQTIVQAASTPQTGFGRVFTVLDGHTVTFRDLTIQHGDTSAGDGGGLWIQASENPESIVTLERVTLADNRAANGDGIANEARLQISDFTLNRNEAYLNGGGLANSGSAELNTGEVVGNQAADLGGGIHSAVSAELTLQNLQIGFSQARTGAGIYNRGAMLVSGSRIFESTTLGGNGGGIFNVQYCRRWRGSLHRRPAFDCAIQDLSQSIDVLAWWWTVRRNNISVYFFNHHSLQPSGERGRHF